MITAAPFIDSQSLCLQKNRWPNSLWYNTILENVLSQNVSFYIFLWCQIFKCLWAVCLKCSDFQMRLSSYIKSSNLFKQNNFKDIYNDIHNRCKYDVDINVNFYYFFIKDLWSSLVRFSRCAFYGTQRSQWKTGKEKSRFMYWLKTWQHWFEIQYLC